MVPQGVITGKVVDSDGDPLPNVGVNLSREVTMKGGQKRRFPAGAQSVTNDLGEFRIAGVSPGTYYLGANENTPGISPERRNHSGGEEILGTAYYPNTTNESAAKPIEIAAGGEVHGIELQLAPVRAFRVRGHLTLPPDVDPRSVMVNLVPEPKGAVGWVMGFGGNSTSDGASNFDIGGVVPGSYVLMASYNDGGKQHTARLRVEVTDQNVDGLAVSFASGVSIAGMVRAAGAPATFRPDSVHVTLWPADGDQAAAINAASANADHTGRFTLDNVSPGRYRVQTFMDADEGYVQSTRYAGQDAADNPIVIGETAGTAAIEVVVAFDGGEVSGIVQNDQGKPTAAAMVAIIPAGPGRQDRARTAISDQDGRFQIRGVPPGSYQAFAMINVDCCAMAESDFRQRYADHAADTVVTPKGAVKVTLRVITGK
jgi:protocatechuate 3,4-dioxygenase beta subunit